MSNEINDLDAIVPVTDTVVLVSGTKVRVLPIKTLEAAALLRIITVGASRQLQTVDWSVGSEALGSVVSALVLAIPNAGPEVVEFINQVVEPVGLRGGKNPNKQDREHDVALWAKLGDELDNPDLEDAVTIIMKVVEQERDNFVALVKKIQSLLSLMQKTGQI